MRRWAGVLIAVMVASPFLTRWYCLWQVPDVALPFDEAKFLRCEDVAPEDDSFIRYAAARQMVQANSSRWVSQGKSTKDVWAAVFTTIEHPDRPLEPEVIQWVTINSDALEEFRLAGLKARAKGESLRTLDVTSILTLHNEFRHMVVLAENQALLYDAVGDVEAAATWRRASLQCARHAETPKLDICRLVSMAIRTVACDGIAHWSESPLVTVSQLRSMRQEIQTETRLRTKRSECSVGEYLACRNTLFRKDAPNHMLPAWNRGVGANPIWLPFKKFGLWLVGQPEVALRLQRQLLVNNWQSIDLPLRERPSTLNCPKAVVFETSGKLAWGQLRPQALADAINNSIFQLDDYTMTISSQHLDQAIHREDARLAAMIVSLACQEYYRDHGELPSQLEQLVPGYLAVIPCDPILATAVPIRYRREADGNATVWSVGVDGVDDGGDVKASGRMVKDEGRRIVAPARVASALSPSNASPLLPP